MSPEDLDPAVPQPWDEPRERAEAEPGGPVIWTGQGEQWAAGFLRGAGGPRGAGFADRGVADLLEPGPVLAELLARATERQPGPGLEPEPAAGPESELWLDPARWEPGPRPEPGRAAGWRA